MPPCTGLERGRWCRPPVSPVTPVTTGCDAPEARRGSGSDRRDTVTAMTDRPRGDSNPEDGSPDYHWLYGGAGAPEPRPDETRVMPVQPRPSDQAGSPTPPPTEQVPT